MKIDRLLLVVSLGLFALFAQAEFAIDRSAMSDAYWSIWNDAEQKKIDADIEAHRKANAVFMIPAPAGTEVTVEQLEHEFRFGAHIFNFDQLGKSEWNEVYRRSYGPGGIFNQATVAFYWKDYEPVPGRLRAGGDYEDTERFWNSLTREEAMDHPFWRRPAPAPVINWLRRRGCTIHGHILIWGLAKPDWIYDWYCPDEEKRAFDLLGIPRNDGQGAEKAGPMDIAVWKQAWDEAYADVSEAEIATMAPVFVRRMPEIFRKRVFDVAAAFGEVVDSWDVVNESSADWVKYRKSRTGLPVWKSGYGLMPGDYPLHALLDAKAAFPEKTKFAINDWNVGEDFLSQVEDLEREGARIDIVGCQMHLFRTNDCMRLAQGATDAKWVGTPQIIQERLDMMAKTGRPIHISEITITSPGSDDRSRMIQAVLTRNIYRKWFSHKAVTGITWWNTVDGGGVKGEPLVSGLFTSDLKKKPAYEALDALINGEWKTSITVPSAPSPTGAGQRDSSRISFRGFRGTYRLSWKCSKCGARHHRDVRLTGNGTVETAVSLQIRGCGTDVRSFTVDGRSVTLAGEETKLDLAKIYPDGVGKEGRDGTQWAEVTFRVKAPKAGEYRIYRYNDYWGELSVNGGKAVTLNGPWRGYAPTKVALAAGENVIRFRTRSGSGGKWACAFRLADELELVR